MAEVIHLTPELRARYRVRRRLARAAPWYALDRSGEHRRELDRERAEQRLAELCRLGAW